MIKHGPSTMEGKLRSLKLAERDVRLGAEVLLVFSGRIIDKDHTRTRISWHGATGRLIGALQEAWDRLYTENLEWERRSDLPFFGGGVL